MASIRRSVAWDHFVDKGNYIAECKMCKSKISFKSGVSNLTKHVRRKHLAVNLVPREPAAPQQQQHAQSSDGQEEDSLQQLESPLPQQSTSQNVGGDPSKTVYRGKIV